MKASLGFGLSVHARFLMPFILRTIQLDELYDLGNIIIRLSTTNNVKSEGQICRPDLLLL